MRGKDPCGSSPLFYNNYLINYNNPAIVDKKLKTLRIVLIIISLLAISYGCIKYIQL